MSRPSCSASRKLPRPPFRRASRRQGFTLIEVLIATAVTLLMMVSLAQIFKIIGDSMKQGRAALELNNRLRSVAFRIRTDLDNMTAIPDPPADPASGVGYFKYYDGSMTDFTAGLYSSSLVAPLAGVDFSRFGDVDDVLMFTARAGDVWFTGKVPLFVLNQVAPDSTNTGLVTIAAQHAEVAVFAEPLVSNVGNPDRNPATLVTNPADGYEKLLAGDGVTVTDLPAHYRLHYRTLLIRPDLNILSTGLLPSGNFGGVSYMVSQAVTGLPSPTCDMIAVHQQCDLSLRRVDPFSAVSSVAANSLEDLVDPANRFAHVQIPLNAAGTWYSLPILALSPKLDIPVTLWDAGSTSVSTPTPQPLEFQSGFLHPGFALFGSRVGEDILASEILSFDVKGYDSGAPLLATLGPDGAPGTIADDDGDGSTALTEIDELGWAGSDDVVLSPNDPGYGVALASGASVVGMGEYVDLGWGWKLRTQYYVTSGANLAAAANTWSQLSGMSSSATAPNLFTDALYKSGLAINAGGMSTSNPPQIFQPSFDTWTSSYEGDGNLQAEPLINLRRGVIRIATSSGTPLREGWRTVAGTYIVDAATDGIDNNPPPAANPYSGAGADDISELETSPPFPVKLRGIKVSIRMEDPGTRQVKQMSVAKEFVTQ